MLRLVVGAVLLIAPTPFAQAGENSRRAATELAVLAGDLRKLGSGKSSTLHNEGLIDRINGSLSGLAILLRLADEELGRVPYNYNSDFEQLRGFWRQRDMARMTAVISKISVSHYFETANILAFKPTKFGLKKAAELHQEFCAGCHDDPDLEVSRPALNLLEQSRGQTVTEFLARMMVGVRGDRISGIDNPLDDAQVSALYRYYLTANTEQ